MGRRNLRRALLGLRARIALLVLLALLPPVALTVVNARTTRADNVLAAQRELSRLTQLTAAQQQQLVDEARSLLMALADAPQIRSGNWRDCRSYLRATLPDFPLYANLGVADTTGIVRCSAVPTHGLIDVSDRSYFQNAIAWDNFASGTYQIGRISGRASVNFGYPTFDSTERASGVVFVALDLGWLERFVARAQLPHRAVMTVFDVDGTVLARSPDPGGFVGRSEAGTELFRMARVGDPVGELVGLDGVSRVYAFDSLDVAEGPIGYMTIGLPTSVLYADAAAELRRNIVVLAVVVIAALIGAWVVSSRIMLRPIDRLTAAADRLAEGDLDARVPEPAGTSELATLAHSFNAMAASLSARSTELEARLDDLRRGDAERRRLLSRLVHAQEEERRRIAEDVHDESVQLMVAAALRLGSLRLQMSEPGAREALDGVESNVRRAIDRLRNVLFELSPQFIERDGVAAALRRYVAEAFAGEETIVRIEDLLRGEPPVESQFVLYRTVQGALANVRAHAHADQVRVELAESNGGVTARVVDDGIGLDTEDLRERPGHLGIDAMRERVELAGGWLRIEGRPGHGTTVECFVPGVPGVPGASRAVARAAPRTA
ncbi:MAG: HAMP domain-containing protein [Actinomycetota bacterium]